MKSRLPILVASAFVSIVLGLFAGNFLNDFLALSIREKTLPSQVSPASFPQTDPLSLRIIDLGGVGILPDTSIWGTTYSHNKKRFEGVFLGHEPYVDTSAFTPVFDQYKTFIDRMAGMGFNAVEIPGFLHFIDFDRVASGEAIYPHTSIFRKRHDVLRTYYNRFFTYAEEKGMGIVLNTDMVALTPPLESYLTSLPGGMDVESDAFWDVYKKGLEELFERMPNVNGIIIRIGEAGAVYNRSGWDYRSELWVRTPETVYKMLSAFLEVAETYDKLIIFRTWSVGIGAVGDMHTHTKSYQAVLGDIQSDHLVVSTKFVEGDFWNHLPLNPTLFQGSHKRIIELQDRREFEAFNVIPNFVSPLHQVALQEFMQTNPNIVGVWAWSQNGGPLRHGPMLLYPFHGFWLWTDANVYATSKIIENPAVDLQTIAADWARLHFGEQDEVAETMANILMNSHKTAIKGLTIPAFARQYVRGLGLEVPPVIYSYWDLVGTSSSVMGNVYLSAREDIKSAVRESFEAVEEVQFMIDQFNEVSPLIQKGKEWVPFIEASLRYEKNLFETMAHHKAFLLHYQDWLAHGGKERKQNWQNALSSYKEAVVTHENHYAGNLDFPAYNFELANLGAFHAERTLMLIWLSRLLIAILITGFVYLCGNTQCFDRQVWVILLVLSIIGPVALFSSFAAPFFTLVAGGLLSIYFFGLYVILYKKRLDAFRWVMLPQLVLLILFMGLMAYRGPKYFWFAFWTSDSFRTIALTMFILAMVIHTITLIMDNLTATSTISHFGALFILWGLPASLFALLCLTMGFEYVLATLNDELLVLPGMLSRILGITTHLNIPLEIPIYLLSITGSLLILGIAFLLYDGKPSSMTMTSINVNTLK